MKLFAIVSLAVFGIASTSAQVSWEIAGCVSKLRSVFTLQSSDASAVLAAHNAIRGARGVGPLKWNEGIAQEAAR